MRRRDSGIRMRWPRPGGNTQHPTRGGPSRDFPGRPAGVHGRKEGRWRHTARNGAVEFERPRFPCPSKAVGKRLCAHRGDRGANLKHRARSAGSAGSPAVTKLVWFSLTTTTRGRGRGWRPAFRAPSDRGPGKTGYGVPGAANNTGDDACAHWILGRHHPPPHARGQAPADDPVIADGAVFTGSSGQAGR